jgi:hypothetical protein
MDTQLLLLPLIPVIMIWKVVKATKHIVIGIFMASKWIQGAIKKKGALRKELGAKKGKPIPAKKLSAAAKKSGVVGKRARLAETLKKMHRTKR